MEDVGTITAQSFIGYKYRPNVEPKPSRKCNCINETILVLFVCVQMGGGGGVLIGMACYNISIALWFNHSFVIILHPGLLQNHQTPGIAFHFARYDYIFVV